jgi:uncharacterized protein involved in exopolysaccharide biosynthesis
MKRDGMARLEQARSLTLFAEQHLQSVEVVDPPSTPTRPLGLGLGEKLALGAIIGAVLGGCIAIAVEQRVTVREELA